MTLQELSRYLELQKQLKRNEEMLGSLERAALPGAQVLNGMPHTSAISDKTGDLAIVIADLKGSIQNIQKEMQMERSKVEKFINMIDNDYTRTVFRLRFLNCMTWKEVATTIGGRNSEYIVKKVCYRYLKVVP